MFEIAVGQSSRLVVGECVAAERPTHVVMPVGRTFRAVLGTTSNEEQKRLAGDVQLNRQKIRCRQKSSEQAA